LIKNLGASATDHIDYYVACMYKKHVKFVISLNKEDCHFIIVPLFLILCLIW